MRIAIGSDHGGLDLKEALRSWLDQTHVVSDVGPHSMGSVDYPEFALRVSELVVSGDVQRGVLVCGTGIGMSIAANKIPGIRAALVHDATTARLAAEHNNANVLCLGGRLLAPSLACELVEIWLQTAFEPRHQHRLDLITRLEEPISPEPVID